MDQGGVAEVVKASLGQELGAGLEPQRLAEANACELVQELWGEDAQSAQHGPPGVDDLGLAVPALPSKPTC